MLFSFQTQEFYQLLYRLMIHDKSDQVWGNTFMSLYTCLKKDIKFCAFGAFCIDNKLLKSISVGILTHLIILIQVSQEIPDYPLNAHHTEVSQ
ncbi:unnamed protein product [Nezara viridula]|uniref:Uncharacterized protein n=1 Tax=Nezara viridula TaxID=85310 RepID=A0A9P0HT00_NEZVI|nr:unnamed protein product [Nezara viridula]